MNDEVSKSVNTKIEQKSASKNNSGLPKRLDRVYRIFGKVEDFIGIMTFTFMTLFTLLNVVFRFILKLPLSWGEEASRYLMILGLMLGLAMGVRDNAHQGMEFFVLLFKGKAQESLQKLGNIINTVTYIAMAVLSINFTMSTIKYGQTSPSLRIPMALMYSFLALGFILAVIENLILYYRIFIAKTLKADEGEAAGVL